MRFKHLVPQLSSELGRRHNLRHEYRKAQQQRKCNILSCHSMCLINFLLSQQPFSWPWIKQLVGTRAGTEEPCCFSSTLAPPRSLVEAATDLQLSTDRMVSRQNCAPTLALVCPRYAASGSGTVVSIPIRLYLLHCLAKL